MPELAYRITEWKSRYEVTIKGHEADDETPADELRRRPLEFYRSKVRGHNKGPAYRRLKSKANRLGVGMGSAVFGIFHDLVELAADQPPQFRGWILCEKQKPMTIEDIADHIIEDIDVVTRAIEILCDPKIGWIQLIEYGPKERNTAEITGIAGNSRIRRVASEDETETKAEEEVKTKAETKVEDSRTNRELGSASVTRGSDFGSDSGPMTKVRATGLLLTYFPTRTTADNTTIRHILEQVPQERYPQLMKAAKESLHGDKPIALFVERSKRLGFRGNGGP